MEKNTTKNNMAIFKYNGGLGALLCSSCRVIIKTGKDFTEEEIKAIKGKGPMPPPAHCSNCKTKQSVNHEGHETDNKEMPKMPTDKGQGNVSQVID